MRLITRIVTVSLAAAAIFACTRDGSAATASAAPAASPSQQLFRDAAAAAPGPEAAIPVQTSLAPLIDKLRPAVVNISTTTVTKHPRVQRGPRGQNPHGGGTPDEGFEDFFERYFGRPAPEMPEEFKGSSLGSGFLLNGEGFILTNNHVVKDATDIRVRLSDDREFGAKIVGRDPLTDVALIQLVNPPKNLPTVVLGDSDALRQGDFVLALGSPFGLRDTATLGIVSAKHRPGINPGGTYDDFIQTDAAINPGNSGGPLFNLRGEVVGINTAIVSPQIGQGIGFAVPINMAKALLPQLKEKGKVTRGFLGVSVSDLSPDLIQGFGLQPGTKGALVQNVVPRSPADKAGLQPGDVVVALNDKTVETAGALTRGVALVSPGQTANLTVLRGGQKKQFAVKVVQRPEDGEAVGRGEQGGGEEGGGQGARDQSPKLGVSIAPITPDVARQFGVEPGDGVVVVDVTEGGPADRAGIRRGDVILEANRQKVTRPEDMRSAVAKLKEGDMALLRVRRGDAAVFIAVPVGGGK
ncbi:trypsin-like peptidase domain-containing protein [Anaeromyxobacter dehalogenans]|uniref:Peptidase S1C, Do n=1 Tax=Anaeromyxobacter dehalogenans (strain 2CP-C) TaxID=290397 RepID=Q2IIR8_ANADE|nr:trypsin-like peptidase domain-containing protein [Anaeromyxobacter dehalogenans]ABC81544.1 peptidase S1C, Do [Anaeromyxobacter dehalogenans 2CP-C]